MKYLCQKDDLPLKVLKINKLKISANLINKIIVQNW